MLEYKNRTKTSLLCKQCNKLILRMLKGSKYWIEFTCPRCKYTNVVACGMDLQDPDVAKQIHTAEIGD